MPYSGPGQGNILNISVLSFLFSDGPSAVHAHVNDYILTRAHRSGGNVLFIGIEQNLHGRSCIEILDCDFHWSDFGNCGKVN